MVVQPHPNGNTYVGVGLGNVLCSKSLRNNYGWWLDQETIKLSPCCLFDAVVDFCRFFLCDPPPLKLRRRGVESQMVT